MRRILRAALHGLTGQTPLHPPRLPRTNGKAERFNRTLLSEWANDRAWTSNTARTQALDRFIQHDNTRRGRSALGGRPPLTGLAS
jgi:transposase InsO family protein